MASAARRRQRGRVREPAAAEQHVIAEPPPLGDRPGLLRRGSRISDLSQRELASRAGVSAATVNRKTWLTMPAADTQLTWTPSSILGQASGGPTSTAWRGR